MLNTLRHLSRRPAHRRALNRYVIRPAPSPLTTAYTRRFATAKDIPPIDPALDELIQKEKAALEGEEKAEAAKQSEDILIEETEKQIGDQTTREFQAETKKILDIVARSLYSDKEIFIRELISNASDALEKVRHLLSTNTDVADSEIPLEINISVDEAKKLSSSKIPVSE
jgi:hypothetical protein